MKRIQNKSANRLITLAILWGCLVFSTGIVAPMGIFLAKADAAVVTSATTLPTLSLERVTFDRVEDQTLFFKTPEGTPSVAPLKTKIFDLSYLGELRPSQGAPYFLLSGRPCDDCLDDKTVYAFRPGIQYGIQKPNAFVYPGKILDPKSRALLFESRAFFGKCLTGKNDVYVLFQKEKVDKRPRLQTSVFFAEAKMDSLSENLLERKLPNIQNTLRLVKKKSCKEISGRNRLMLAKPLDLTPKNHDNEADDRDDDADNADEADGIRPKKEAL